MDTVEIDQASYWFLLSIAEAGLLPGAGRVLAVDDEGGLTTIDRDPEPGSFGSRSADMSAVRAGGVARRLAKEGEGFYHHVYLVQHARPSDGEPEIRLFEQLGERLTRVVPCTQAVDRSPRLRPSALA